MSAAWRFAAISPSRAEMSLASGYRNSEIFEPGQRSWPGSIDFRQETSATARRCAAAYLKCGSTGDRDIGCTTQWSARLASCCCAAEINESKPPTSSARLKTSRTIGREHNETQGEHFPRRSYGARTA